MMRMKGLSTMFLATACGIALAQEPAPRPGQPPQDKPKPDKPKPDQPRDEKKDHTFVTKSVETNLMMVALGELTISQSQNLDVKAFGQRMVAEHEKLNTDLKQLAQKKSINISDRPSDADQKSIDGWKKLTGNAFDTRFVGQMVTDHEKMVDIYKRASNDAQDADIKAYATNALPKLEEHLKQARDLKDKITKEDKPKPDKPTPDRPDKP